MALKVVFISVFNTNLRYSTLKLYKNQINLALFIKNKI